MAKLFLIKQGDNIRKQDRRYL